MKKLLFCMVMNIFLIVGVVAVHAEEHGATTAAGDIVSEPQIVESEKVAEESKALPVGSDMGAAPVSMPPPRDESWKRGVNAFGNYNYEQAIFCFIESPSPLSKYYLAKIYFGDVFMNNLEGTSLPEINRQKAIEVLDTVINYVESQELKNKYTSLINSVEALSRFYYERGNYEEAEKAIEHVQGKEAEEIRHRYRMYSQSLKNPAPVEHEDAVFSEKPELKLPQKKAASENTQAEPTFIEEKSKGHESFSEAACFVDGHHQQISDESDEMIAVDSQSSSAKEHHPSAIKHDEDRVPAESVSDMPPQKGNVLVSIKPAIVWDWPALPGYDYKPVARIATETKMVLLDDIATKWYYKVELPDSKVGYICSYLVKRVDNTGPKKSVQKTEIIEECSEYINYLVDRHEEKKKAAQPKPKTPIKKKKHQVVKKSVAKKQPAKSAETHTVKPQPQSEVRFMDEAPVQHPSPLPSSPEKSVHTGTEEGKH
ncbi:hypothetical protein HY792_06410 [Candidatus Desantisbacteria bacterium]|nr:hypothetical protein [Candidatus Desantisbacteria bacterium]